MNISRVTAVLCGVAFLLSATLGYAADSAAGGDLRIDAKSFRCITKMTRVRHFYVDNLRGNLAATVAAANSKVGAVYPPGSVIQLVPGEAMVKREKGFNATTHDWEFSCAKPTTVALQSRLRVRWSPLCKERIPGATTRQSARRMPKRSNNLPS